MTALDIDGRAESSEQCVFVRGIRRSKYSNARHFDSCCTRDGPHLDLNLLKTCRSIYSEAALMPYTSNTFVPADLPTLGKFLSSLKPVQLGAIRRMSLEFVISAYKEMWNEQCEKLTGLEYLRLELRSQCDQKERDPARRLICGHEQALRASGLKVFRRMKLKTVKSVMEVMIYHNVSEQEEAKVQVIEWLRSVRKRLIGRQEQRQ